MTKHKYRFVYNFIYFASLLFVGVLIASAYFATRYYYIFIPILSIVFVINVIAYVRQIQTYYFLGEFGIEKWRKKTCKIVLYEDVVTIKETKMYYEIEYRTPSKVRTLYLSKLLNDFEMLKQEFERNLKECNKEVIFF